MNIDERDRTAGYFKRALELDRLEDVQFDSKEMYVTAYKSELGSGILDHDRLEKLFRDYSDKNSVKMENIEGIDVIVSIFTLYSEGLAYQGILNVPATLNREGRFSFDVNKSMPWIPRERLKTSTNGECDVMVGDLSSFWEFQKERKDLISQIEPGEWEQYIDYSEKLFRYVEKNYDEKSVSEQAAESGERLIEDQYFIKNWESIDPTPVICDLYKKIELETGELPLFDRMISVKTPKDNAAGIEKGNRQLVNTLRSTGTMSAGYPLADSQRLAMHAFSDTADGEVLAVSGPPGTGKTTMLQAVVGSTLVDNALQGLTAPVIVGTSTNNQAVTNIIDSFGKVVSKDHRILDFRWLPRLDEKKQPDGSVSYGLSYDADKKYETMSGIAAYCPAKGRVDEARKKGLITEQADRSITYAMYSETDYIRAAKEFFIGQASLYLDKKIDSLEKIRDQIRAALQDADKVRTDVLSAAWNYKEAFSGTAGLNRSKNEIVLLDDRINGYKESLKFWMQVDSEYPEKGFIKKKRPVSDESIIALKKRDSDSFGDSINSIEEIINFYSYEIRKSQNDKKEIVSGYEKLEAVKKAFEKAFDRVMTYQDGARWYVNQEYRFTFGEQRFMPGELPEHIDSLSPEELFAELDKYMDITLRYCEFWLAVHYFESNWLILADNGELMGDDERWKNTPAVQDKYWEQGPNLTPCMVMTEYQLPRYFSSYDTETKENNADFGRIDLLITDEAGQVNTPVAMAGFSLANKAIVLGDTRQLAPIWGLDEETDNSTAREFGITDQGFKDRKGRGLTCSEPASIMLAAENACKWKYSEDEAGLFLEEHYRCVDGIIEFCNKLIYQGRLKPCRGKGSVLKLRLEEKQTGPFVIYTVKGSEDRHSGSSRFNDTEAEAIAGWIRDNKEELIKIYSSEKASKSISEIIGVVTPFAAQARRIKKILEGSDGLKNITVGTAHRLQGAERPVILFSATYGNNSPDAGFVNKTPNLMNVAVSRAKDLFIVFAAEKRSEDSGNVFKLINDFGQHMQLSFADAEDNRGSADETRICPECGRTLVIKKGKFGEFWGCTGYNADPPCKYTESINKKVY
jgi:hypothetical protein